MDTVVERIHEAARLMLVCEPNNRTRWVVPHSPPDTSDSPTTPVNLHPKTTVPSRGGRLDLDASCFPDKRSFFQLVQPKDGAPATQNLLLFLHGCGDSHKPFARLGEQMALPQTELPFDLGFAWMDDFDETGAVIRFDIPHQRRSRSLQAARDYVWNFLGVLHDRYGWDYSRLFLFAYSQAACVSFHLAMTLPRDVRLGGIVLVSGGAIAGSHSACSGVQGGAVATPMLQITGAADSIYPAALAQRSCREFKCRHSHAAAVELFTSLARPRKGHAMIDCQEDMRHVMLFFSKHLYLCDIALENRSDVVEIQT